MREVITTTRNRKSLNELLAEISESIPDKEALVKDVDRYMVLSLESLPAFNNDGSVAFYEVGGVLLGKSALIRFISRCRDHKYLTNL